MIPTLSYFRRARSGGVMVVALLALTAATAGFAGWMVLLKQRTRAGDFGENAVKKRVAVRNARATVKEYVLRRAVTESADTGAGSFDPGGGWGQVNFPVWSGLPMDSTTRLAGLNSFSPTWDYPYTKSISFGALTKNLTFDAGVAQYDDVTHSVRALIRSRNPLLSGDLLVVHRPTDTSLGLAAVTGNVSVLGRVLHFAPDTAAASYTAQSKGFAAPYSSSATINIAPKDLNGNLLAWSNLPWLPMTAGKISGVTDWTGRLNVIDDSANGGNSLKQELTGALTCTGGTPFSDSRGLVSNGTGTVTITPVVSTTSSDLPSVIINGETSEIIIEGQDEPLLSTYAPFRPAMVIVFVQSVGSTRNLTTIRLRKNCNRRMLIALKQTDTFNNVNVVVEQNSGTVANWQSMIVAERCPLTFTGATSTQIIQLTGGIQTNASVTAPASPAGLRLALQTDTRGLIKLSPRMAWVETILQGTL